MEKTIKELYEITNRFKMFYAYAYNDGPSVGLRAVDNVITDGIVWLVAADITANGKKLETVTAINEANIADIVVTVRASAFVYGMYVTAEVGKFIVEEKMNCEDVLNKRGFLTISRI